MADIEIERSHDREVEEVRHKITEVLEQQDRIRSVDWGEEGGEAHIDGEGFDGDIELGDSSIIGRIQLSPMAKPFRDMIEKRLVRQVDDILNNSSS